MLKTIEAPELPRPRVRRLGLAPWEAAFLLQDLPLFSPDPPSEATMRRALRRAHNAGGPLVLLDGAGRRLARVSEMRRLLGQHPVAYDLLDALAAGDIRCPRSADPTCRVPPLSSALIAPLGNGSR